MSIAPYSCKLFQTEQGGVGSQMDPKMRPVIICGLAMAFTPAQAGGHRLKVRIWAANGLACHQLAAKWNCGSPIGTASTKTTRFLIIG